MTDTLESCADLIDTINIRSEMLAAVAAGLRAGEINIPAIGHLRIEAHKLQTAYDRIHRIIMVHQGREK